MYGVSKIMIYVFAGDDRKKIAGEVRKVLGEDHEVFEGENLGVQDLVNICQGRNLFNPERKILIRDLTPVRKDEGEGAPGIDSYAELIKYVDTPHTIVIWETALSKKKSFQEFKKAKGVKVQTFKIVKDDWRRPYEICDLALRDGKKAVLELRKIEEESDPYLFVGILTAKIYSQYEYSFREKDKRALLELSELDMLMKTSKIAPWRLVEGFLLRLDTI